MDDGYYITDFRLPCASHTLKTDTLDISCQATIRNARMIVSVYNWNSKQWIKALESRGGAIVTSRTVPSPGGCVLLPEGVVRVRVEVKPARPSQAGSGSGSIGGISKGPGMMGGMGTVTTIERLEIGFEGHV